MVKVDNAGEYRLTSFIISSKGKSVDLSNIVHTFTIQESMGLTSVRGSAKIYDSTGLLYKFPLIGEETLEITYDDFFGISRTDRMFVYSISDVEPVKSADSNTLGITLHFVSQTRFNANQRMVRKSYTGLVSTIAGDLFDAFYTDADTLNIETTTGFQRLSIPNMQPDDAMNFLARRAYSSDDESSMIRFFQNRDGYYFVSPGYYADRYANTVPVFNYNSYSDQTPEGQLALMDQIISIDFGETVNTIDDLNEGNYNASTIELDILKRQVENSQYKYMDEYQSYEYPDGQASTRHTKEFMDNAAQDPHVTVVFKDYGDPNVSQFPSLRPATYEHKTFNHKYAAYHHLNSNMISIKIYGRNSIVAGSVVELDLVRFMKDSNTVEKDTLWSGKYFVEGVENVFHENTYMQVLRISKSGVRAIPEESSGVPYALNETNPVIDIPDTDAFIIGPQ